MTHAFGLAIAAVFAVGCSEQGFHSVDGAGGGDGAAIEVTPAWLDFGLLGADDEAVVQQFTVKSVGRTDLEVSGFEITGDAPASYTILSNLQTFVLPPGAEEVIDVAFLPMGAHEQRATALVLSNDQDNQAAPVELAGEGQIAELNISPDPLDFGSRPIDCPVYSTLTLTNRGTDELTITEIVHEGADYTITDQPTLPLTLLPEELTTMELAFSPSSTTAAAGLLSVTSTEPMGVRQATQTGVGNTGGELTDVFDVPVDPPTDILFSLDSSCSMTWDIIELYNNFDAFVNELEGFSEDWQLIVAKKDDGCHNNQIIRPTNSDPGQAFYDAMFAWGSGDYTEALLSINEAAVHATDSGECNAGFMREDAMLHIINISDEPEQSVYINGRTWDELTNSIIDKKGTPALVTISAIAGDVPGGCDDADPGTGYAEAVDMTGGVFISICQNWATKSNLGLLAEASVAQNRFPLSAAPVPSTIVVEHNGQVRTTWTYESALNAVVFTEKPPTEGDHVEITYETTGGACD